jgi:hypothetical protein
VSDPNSIASPSPLQAAPGGVGTKRRQRFWLNTSQPVAAGLIALALAITLSGFANRLARYDLHSDHISRASMTKLGDKHQNVIRVAGSRLRARPSRALALNAVSPAQKSLPESAAVSILPVHNDPGVIASFPSLLPFRGPPAHSLA